MSCENNKMLGLCVGAAMGALAAVAIAGIYVCRKRCTAPDQEDLPKVLEEAHKTVQRLTEAIESIKS